MGSYVGAAWCVRRLCAKSQPQRSFDTSSRNQLYPDFHPLPPHVAHISLKDLRAGSWRPRPWALARLRLAMCPRPRPRLRFALSLRASHRGAPAGDRDRGPREAAPRLGPAAAVASALRVHWPAVSASRETHDTPLDFVTGSQSRLSAKVPAGFSPAV
jgi:hypothetical protein